MVDTSYLPFWAISVQMTTNPTSETYAKAQMLINDVRHPPKIRNWLQRRISEETDLQRQQIRRGLRLC